MPRYLPWLAARLAGLGGRIEKRTVASLDEVFRSEATSLVVNCTGLAAGELLDDPELHPIRGQIVRVGPGHARRFVQAASGPGALAYIIPRPDCTVLGGTAQAGDWNERVDPATAAAIRDRCVALEPALLDAPVLSHAVGLRPGRARVRLETEDRPAGRIVHNYGHGGAGVTLSWGCADEVVRLAAG
jgi:D-amino-acid oxidase